MFDYSQDYVDIKNLFLEHPCPPGTPLTPCRFQVLGSGFLTIKMSDGTLATQAVGTGEQIDVMMPQMQYGIPSHRTVAEVPLSDGQSLLAFSKGLKVMRVKKPLT